MTLGEWVVLVAGVVIAAGFLKRLLPPAVDYSDRLFVKTDFNPGPPKPIPEPVPDSMLLVVREAGKVDANGNVYTEEALRKAVDNWHKKYSKDKPMPAGEPSIYGGSEVSVMGITHFVEDVFIGYAPNRKALAASVKFFDTETSRAVAHGLANGYFRLGLSVRGSMERKDDHWEVVPNDDLEITNIHVLPADAPAPPEPGPPPPRTARRAGYQPSPGEKPLTDGYQPSHRVTGEIVCTPLPPKRKRAGIEAKVPATRCPHCGRDL